MSKSNIHKFLIQDERNQKGKDLLREIKATLGIGSITSVNTRQIYRLEGLTQEQAYDFAMRILCEPLIQTCSTTLPETEDDAPLLWYEVAYKRGVMNPAAASIVKTAHDDGLANLIAADTSWTYCFHGNPTQEELERIFSRLLVNATVEQLVTEEPLSLLTAVIPGPIELVAIREMTDEELTTLSSNRSLFLNLEEMRVIRQYFIELGRDPTDGEIEMLAQTWSEHCCHKIARAKLKDAETGAMKEPLLRRLREESAKYPDNVLSSFVDNSGVILFYDGWAICAKIETHNAPSALEPYGGANTGTGGVIRDPMGTGQGAKTILSVDVFCVAPPDLPSSELPEGCLPPRYLFQRVVAGVRDYGNRMGIPTSNGSVHFHPDFRAKPSVIVGAVGILPEDKCQKGEPEPGDLILVLGGRTGRDGIHGATFSSGMMTDSTTRINGSAVQIGNAIEEERLEDAILDCRDANLTRALTDCGAGGLSSAIGEMGATVGAEVWLEKAPLKYSGLAPWEIWISESQERMVVCCKEADAPTILQFCKARNVEATVVGKFTGNSRILVTHNDNSLCDLSMDFLHNGLPQRVMTMRRRAKQEIERLEVDEPGSSTEWEKLYARVMAHGNVCSKEPIVRMYDHRVQGSSALMPFSGPSQAGPNDATVLCPILGKPYGVVFSHGLNPVLNRIDPYHGGLWAAVEALSNYVAVGGDYHEAALIDNFIWPYPDEEYLWDLDQSFEACITAMRLFGIPFVSGKDSLSSTYKKRGLVIHVPPVLCVSVFGKIPDVSKTVTADLKRNDSLLFLAGELDTQNLGGSAYYDVLGVAGGGVPLADYLKLPTLFDWLHRHIVTDDILSCHDISEGGLGAAIAEMCIGGEVEAEICVPENFNGRPDHWFFSETSGCFVLEVSREKAGQLIEDAARLTIPLALIGRVSSDQDIWLKHSDGQLLFVSSLRELKQSWQQPMKEVFGE
ncbi:MAG: AIR synthase-related protein [bacterium]|nr:AIR synthase-related protein [bacterium]